MDKKQFETLLLAGCNKIKAVAEQGKKDGMICAVAIYQNIKGEYSCEVKIWEKDDAAGENDLSAGTVQNSRQTGKADEPVSGRRDGAKRKNSPAARPVQS